MGQFLEFFYIRFSTFGANLNHFGSKSDVYAFFPFPVSQSFNNLIVKNFIIVKKIEGLNKVELKIFHISMHSKIYSMYLHHQFVFQIYCDIVLEGHITYFKLFLDSRF